MPSCPLNIAVSRLVRSLTDYGRAYAAARRGLDLARLLGRSQQVISFRRLGVQEILLQVEEPASLLEFISRYVEPLERYDEQHSSKLLVSLETFYDSGFNLQEAARRLDVHVSTLALSPDAHRGAARRRPEGRRLAAEYRGRRAGRPRRWPSTGTDAARARGRPRAAPDAARTVGNLVAKNSYASRIGGAPKAPIRSRATRGRPVRKWQTGSSR